jgi:uncharacterized PurR-regulated membrane protein YhhQ (DUF165 family)
MEGFMGRLGGAFMFGLLLSAVLIIMRTAWSLHAPWSLLLYPGETLVRDSLHGLAGWAPAAPIFLSFFVNTLVYAMVAYLLSFLKPRRDTV